MFPSAFNSGGLVDPGANGANFDPRNLMTVQGYSPARAKQMSQRRVVQVAECSKMWADFANGKVDPFLMMEAVRGPRDWTFSKLQSMAPSIFNEAMTLGDFTALTTTAVERVLLEKWKGYPKVFEQIAKVNRQIKDFRQVERWEREGGELPYQKVGELAGFNRQSFVTGKYTYQVYKYEKGAAMSWEAVINDDMGIFKDVPDGLALGGIRTVEQYVLGLIAGSTGPNSSMYGTAISLAVGGTVKNVIDLSSYSTGTFTGANNPPVTALNLILAAGLLLNQQTAEGRPIDPFADELIVLIGDGVLYQTVMQIINTDQIATTVLGGTKASSAVAPDLIQTSKNWIRGRLKPVYAPELRNIVNSNLATSWWLFANPNVGKPAVEVGFLQGYDSPQLYRKAPNAVRVGGGLDEQHGDFDTMSTELKGLIVFGGTRMNPRMTMASNGTGS